MTPATLEDVRDRLRTFAGQHAATISPLYSHLAAHAADDDEVAGLLTATTSEHADPTLLFAAVQRVLQSEPFHELTNYYPSLGGSYGPDNGTWPLFRSFVLERLDRVRDLIATRVTQTNEVRRAALLYPAVAMAARQARAPVALLEVGTSAGLLLGLGTYSYRYQTQQAGQLVAGPTRSPVGLHCALAVAPGATLPTIPKKIAVATRIGLDAEPVDLADEEQYAWLEACIWPDQPERLRLFGAAAAALRKSPPDLVAGDAVDDLAAVADRIPPDEPIVVLTSNVLWLLDETRRAAFVAELAAIAARRPVWWVSQEGYRAALAPLLPDRADLEPPPEGPTFGVLGLVHWSDGTPQATALARTAWHGERMEWLA
ncbi:DUF2332 domain-containing protein [Actinophytocola xanthii]|uniref:DUF2332 domain-containing protein n=1 Tax=Actinophytocola xanthii TaxID=1912961 RepID=A0A1Q8CPZ1_9PSEU|nr:DUF2332 domain-containing protein [Actinophytocola xanthii]OLF16424.1 hypothetical protein BU204_16385 [Actinophytocola xanthii]